MAQAEAKQQVQEVAGQAQEQVKQQAGQAKEKARDQVNERSTQAGERVTTAAGDARSVAEELRKQGKDTPARYAEQAADRAERIGGYLKDADADRILRDVEDLGRRQPWAVIAGGLAVGFMASRFLKASSSERYQAGRSSGSPHTSPSNGHPAGTGVRSDRDVGGPTTAPVAPGGATGGAPGTPPGSGFSSHR
jgi:hypothetical protein